MLPGTTTGPMGTDKPLVCVRGNFSSMIKLLNGFDSINRGPYWGSAYRSYFLPEIKSETKAIFPSPGLPKLHFIFGSFKKSEGKNDRRKNFNRIQYEYTKKLSNKSRGYK